MYMYVLITCNSKRVGYWEDLSQLDLIYVTMRCLVRVQQVLAGHEIMMQEKGNDYSEISARIFSH